MSVLEKLSKILQFLGETSSHYKGFHFEVIRVSDHKTIISVAQDESNYFKIEIINTIAITSLGMTCHRDLLEWHKTSTVDNLELEIMGYHSTRMFPTKGHLKEYLEVRIIRFKANAIDSKTLLRLIFMFL